MKVLLDVVYNHAGYNSRYLTDPKTQRWLRSNETGTCGSDDITTCVSGLPDFKTEMPEVREYLLNAHLGLAKRVGLDGFRLDTVKHVTHDFWQEHRQRARAELGKDFFLIGEVWGGDAQSLDPWFEGDEMDAGFDFSFQGSALAWLQGRGPDGRLRPLSQVAREGARRPSALAPICPRTTCRARSYSWRGTRSSSASRRCSADRRRPADDLLRRRGGPARRRLAGQPERHAVGRRARILPGAGKPRDEALRGDYKKLIAMRKAHPALSRGVHTALSTTATCSSSRRTRERRRGDRGVNRGTAAGDGGSTRR